MANWDKISSRGKIEDRRGMAMPAGGVGIVGIGIVLAVMYFGGVDEGVEVMNVLQDSNSAQPITTKQSAEFVGEDKYELFASRVLGIGNIVWNDIAKEKGISYREPTLVLFRDATKSACGGANSSSGPHYCPLDETIYLDETFFDEMSRRFGAKGGDVAEAYVIAHELGHHVQNIFGTMDRVRIAQNRSPNKTNLLSIQQELQADCFAGIWAHALRGQGIFEKNEIIEAMDAAEAVGDDRIQEKTTGRINPESWTHGSSEDRKNWFTRGYESGEYSTCNTYKN